MHNHYVPKCKFIVIEKYTIIKMKKGPTLQCNCNSLHGALINENINKKMSIMIFVLLVQMVPINFLDYKMH